MKITMYELLGMVKDGKAPKKIKWEDTIYAYSDYDKDYLEFPFSDEEYKGLFNMKDSILTQFLNDEVEILEEEPRDIEVCGCLLTKSEYDKLAHSEEEKKIPDKLTNLALTYNNKILVDKINEIIDYLKSKGDE